MSVLIAADVKSVRDALCAAAIEGAHPDRLKEIRESLVRELTALKEATAKPAATAK